MTTILIVTALAWAYVLKLATDMHTMDMSGMGMSGNGIESMLRPTFQSWTGGQFLIMLTMWAVMMVGMMTPSAAPMLLLYARVGRQARLQNYPFAATGWFAVGYLFMWVFFALIATGAQWQLERAALLTPMLASASHVFGGILLIAAGIYQWLAIKDACLTQCQSPLTFIQQHGGFSATQRGALKLGLRHGLYCVGCCWALMLLLFVGGVMNILWIAGLTVLILLEKVVPTGRLIPRIVGLLLIGLGFGLLFN
ncbi:MAG: DUF2182 domain-containing protein [Aquirhabdus sp.]